MALTKRQQRRGREKIAAKLSAQSPTKFKQLDLSIQSNVPDWMSRAFANNRYMVMINDNAETTKGNAIRVLIQTVDDKPIIGHWRELQNIKNEIFGEECEAIEYYPKESELVDKHNIYWLWIFPDGILPKMMTP